MLTNEELRAVANLTNAVNRLAKVTARSNSLKGQKARGKAFTEGVLEGIENKNLMDMVTKALRGEIASPKIPYPGTIVGQSPPPGSPPFNPLYSNPLYPTQPQPQSVGTPVYPIVGCSSAGDPLNQKNRLENILNEALTKEHHG